MLTKIFSGLFILSPWKVFLGGLLKPVGGKLLLHYKLDILKLHVNIFLPAFYRQCLVAWPELNASKHSSVHEIAVIWNNISSSVFVRNLFTRRDITNQGFCKMWDLFSADDKQLNREQSFFIMSVINSMPAQ